MDPITVAIIGAVVFGVASAFAVFVRELLLSRDKQLNEEAQQRALAQETKELEKIRVQMETSRRFDSHYQVLGANKDAIRYLDQKIEEILNKKLILVQRYAQMTLKESEAIVAGKAVLEGSSLAERKATCDLLRAEIDEEIKYYESELQQLQKRRASLWDAHNELQTSLLAQEKARNERLDGLYTHHSGVLEKVYLRHDEHLEAVTKKSIDAGTEALKILLAPFHFLLKLFKLSDGIFSEQAQEEIAARKKVSEVEREINEIDYEHRAEGNFRMPELV
ncbi:hypothetical protein ELY11_04165 [Legionella septentrionalis]|uniref:Uncharacterized protein n=2 Tax=Legionella septentrionalis TaxID=2498109 RepID=A0A433JGG4_9GAMM|nr:MULTISPECIES: hypothetical protein [Legionella]MCP0913554.1 Atg14 domain-containing protein [Legionella sp. 27cVA30]RUQ79217.1 hypothetical protein EKM59_11230 [Legionella septentrionalis]RUQ99782.1 hypothetical protein ELY11_04165 [Legionella septentrionalis]RUR15908.1 hypothetical protein ELY10_04470 [Legionella septentrionalis]